MPRLPPGPLLPVIGPLIMPGRDPLTFFTRLVRTYGDVAYFRMGGERVYFVSHPDYIRQVLVTDGAKYAKGRALERARKLLGDGLLTSYGASHDRKRKLVQPGFHRARIAAYADTMIDCARQASAGWRDGETIDVSSAMMRLTLSIAARTLFDVAIDRDADQVGRAMTRVLESFWLTLLPFSDVIAALPLAAARESRAARHELDRLIFDMMAHRRAGGSMGNDVLSTLLQAGDESGEGLSDEEIRDEVMTLILAGHETTANALTWTWYLLSTAPASAAAMRSEVDAVLGDRSPGADDLASLPYVTKVVTEAMRLYPPAWLVGRRALEACEVGGYTVPRGAMVFMSQWTMHHDERYYADAGRFEPERWSAAFRASLPRYAYFPFGGGSRHCIGESFAWMELTLLVAWVARRWDLRLVPGHRVVPHPLITLRSKHGMQMTLHRRQTGPEL
jgi:cytochrome P450